MWWRRLPETMDRDARDIPARERPTVARMERRLSGSAGRNRARAIVSPVQNEMRDLRDKTFGWLYFGTDRVLSGMQDACERLVGERPYYAKFPSRPEMCSNDIAI